MEYIKTFESFTSVLLAPNGKPSNLTPKLYKIVRTPAFKLWFGDWENNPDIASKAVDENGEPLVHYHGTKAKFTEFKTEFQLNGWLGRGFYFTDDKKAAKAYGRSVIEVFLNIRNPFMVKGDDPYSVTSEAKAQYNIDIDYADDVSIMLKEHNHDGVFFKHWDQGTMNSCFYPEQIRQTKEFK